MSASPSTPAACCPDGMKLPAAIGLATLARSPAVAEVVMDLSAGQRPIPARALIRRHGRHGDVKEVIDHLVDERWLAQSGLARNPVVALTPAGIYLSRACCRLAESFRAISIRGYTLPSDRGFEVLSNFAKAWAAGLVLDLAVRQHSSRTLSLSTGHDVREVESSLRDLAEAGLVVQRGATGDDDPPAWFLQPETQRIVPALAFLVRAEIARDPAALARILPEHAEAVSRLCVLRLRPEDAEGRFCGVLALACVFPGSVGCASGRVRMHGCVWAGTVVHIDEFGELLSIADYRRSMPSPDGVAYGDIDACLRFLSENDPRLLKSWGSGGRAALKMAAAIARSLALNPGDGPIPLRSKNTNRVLGGGGIRLRKAV